MSNINDGWQAFPFAATDPSNAHLQSSGMSMRDYVAIHAPITLDDAIDLCGFNRSHHPMRNDTDRFTILAVMMMARFEYADAFLAARSDQRKEVV